MVGCLSYVLVWLIDPFELEFFCVVTDWRWDGRMADGWDRKFENQSTNGGGGVGGKK